MTDLPAEHEASTRRALLYKAAMIAAGSAASLAAAGQAAYGQQTADHDMSQFPAHWHGSEQIAFLIYPGFTALDLVGPHYMLASLMGATVHIVAKTSAPVTSDQKLVLTPSATFDTCPADLDIICIPGGSNGTLAAMQDAATITFLKDRGSRAKYITSVCTGSLLLAAAGLLKGYKATSHWVARPLLAEFGAEPVDQRVVVDRNRITGAGVTAGLDFGLTLTGRLRDDVYAKGVQLLAEYHPEPPFNAGTPQGAGAELTTMMSSMFDAFSAEVRALAAKQK